MERILVVEDEEVLRMLVVDTLVDEGYKVDEACDGDEAIELFKKHAYDLVIVDYMMPGYTGLDLIKRLRLQHEEVKIIMLSAKNQASQQQKVLEAGADAFISKPFSPLALVARIEEILRESA
ncbi:response regulator transcription factor [Fredinandcohnia sp. 179-A 10B2 NHS]|uniref:response regulator transcription factor n=1 Tax=Fredinandcohnia sp. 179-A 10B2 NHS TaxID=3235176 RepID=UPI0039A087F1